MKYEELLENARKSLSATTCKVCNECNGVACRGKIPGVGGKGNGNGFVDSVKFLSSIKIKMDTIYQYEGQDSSISLFGNKFKYPFFPAPIGGFKINYNGILTENEYDYALINGSYKAGIAAFIGEGLSNDIFLKSMSYIKDINGLSIPTIKPWNTEVILERIKMMEEANIMAFAMDIDSAGLTQLALIGRSVSPKSVEELKKITNSTKMPLIIKGILTAEGAKKALEVGAYGIVVSSHGGRVLPDAPAPCSVLPEIRQTVGDKLKIFVDGGIRTGADVFKAIALGADAALIGRPYAISVFGGSIEGVELYTQKIGNELIDTMLMSGCKTLSDITMDKIIMN